MKISLGYGFCKGEVVEFKKTETGNWSRGTLVARKEDFFTVKTENNTLTEVYKTNIKKLK